MILRSCVCILGRSCIAAPNLAKIEFGSVELILDSCFQDGCYSIWLNTCLPFWFGLLDLLFVFLVDLVGLYCEDWGVCFFNVGLLISAAMQAEIVFRYVELTRISWFWTCICSLVSSKIAYILIFIGPFSRIYTGCCCWILYFLVDLWVDLAFMLILDDSQSWDLNTIVLWALLILVKFMMGIVFVIYA